MEGDKTAVSSFKDDVEWEEFFIFRLSKRLGGRSEVRETPVVEALKYIEWEKKREQADRFSLFLSLFYANPMVDAEARKAFIESIQPETDSVAPVYETDIEQLKRLKAMQGEEV